MKSIKTALSSLLLVALALTSRAQGTLIFTAYLHGTNVVPPSLLPDTGTGVFTLEGNSLNYSVRTPFLTGFDAVIYGPAVPGSNGPTLFALRFKEGVPPLPPEQLGYGLWQGTTMIRNDHIPDLVAGLWYVQLTSRYFPEGALRGQIIPVPEPNVGLMIVIGTCLVVWLFRQRDRKSPRFHTSSALRFAKAPITASVLIVGTLQGPSGVAATNDPPLMTVPERRILTNGSPVYFRDRSLMPDTPSGALTSLGASPDLATNFYALGWDQICYDSACYINEICFVAGCGN
jgi:hypothetical protein